MTASSWGRGGARSARTPRLHVHAEREQHVALGPADAVGHEGGDVAVATVFAQQVAPVPEPIERFVGHRQRPDRGVERPSLGRRARPRLHHQVGGSSDVRRVGPLAEDPPQGGHRTRARAAFAASGVTVFQTSGMWRATSPGAKL